MIIIYQWLTPSRTCKGGSGRDQFWGFAMVLLCLSIFDWARFRRRKGAIKLHTLLDFDSCLPTYIDMTDGKVHDAKAAKEIVLPPDSVVVADRAYVDFDTLNKWHKNGSYFVVRLKKSINYDKIVEKKLPDNRHQHILIDELIELSEEKTKAKYPRKLRRVVVYDKTMKEAIEIITNQFTWTANTIGELYKSRWQIEIFFKEIKQLLKIKTFLGTSKNAVLIQIWTAMISILIYKYLRVCSKINWNLSNLVASIRLNLIVKINLRKLLDKDFSNLADPPKNQLSYQYQLFKWGD